MVNCNPNSTSASPQDPSDVEPEVPQSWCPSDPNHALLLARTAIKLCYVRLDARGRYTPTGKAFTVSGNTSSQTYTKIASHFWSEGKDRVGAHTVSQKNDCKYGGFDIDLHGDENVEQAGKNLAYALHLCEGLTDAGFKVVLEDSNGAGGYHVLVFFEGRVPAVDLRSYLVDLGSGYEQHGVDKPEVFPKQNDLNPDRPFGNYLRLPGKHHKRDHQSVFYDFERGEWMTVEQSVAYFLELEASRNSVDLVPRAVEPVQNELQDEGDNDVDNADEPFDIPDTVTGFEYGTEARQKVQVRPFTDFCPSSWKPFVIDAAREALRNRPLSIEDEGGSQEMFMAARSLVVEWGITDKNDLREALGEYNETRCVPRWTDGPVSDPASLRRKIDQAIKSTEPTFFRPLRALRRCSWGTDLLLAQVCEPKAVGHLYRQLEAEQKEESRRRVGELRGGPGSAPTVSAIEKVTAADVFTPFPIDELPETLGKLVDEGAQAIGCDASFIALPVLSVCASAIGGSRQLRVKRSWNVPSILWTVVLGESGSQKTPAFKLAVQPVKDRQKKHQRAFEKRMVEYAGESKDYVAYEKARTGKKGDPSAPRREEPNRPILQRCIVSDATIEAMAPILSDNPRGVLVGRDELSGWIGGFDRYSSKGSATSEVQKWLEIYGAENIFIDRKSADAPSIMVDRPHVSICGGIQPGILARCLTDEHKENGLQSRLLMAYPPRQPKRWRDEDVSEETMDAYDELINGLFSLDPQMGVDGEESLTVLLDAAAKVLYVDFVNKHGEEQASMNGHLASQWSKLEEIPARLALVFHCVKGVGTNESGVGTWDAKVDFETMASAIRVTEWFKAETLRINRVLAGGTQLSEDAQLAEWIKTQGGSITARDLCRNRRNIASSADAEKGLMRLVQGGLGEWEPTGTSRRFRLLSS